MDLRDIKAKLILWMKYALRIDVRWLYLTKRGEKERTFTHPRYEILINPIQFS